MRPAVRLRCLLGWHRWGQWRPLFDFDVQAERRDCARCTRYEIRPL